jgi:hypothetical protein
MPERYANGVESGKDISVVDMHPKGPLEPRVPPECDGDVLKINPDAALGIETLKKRLLRAKDYGHRQATIGLMQICEPPTFIRSAGHSFDIGRDSANDLGINTYASKSRLSRYHSGAEIINVGNATYNRRRPIRTAIRITE